MGDHIDAWEDEQLREETLASDVKATPERRRDFAAANDAVEEVLNDRDRREIENFWWDDWRRLVGADGRRPSGY
jgi:hypothetical protein